VDWSPCSWVGKVEGLKIGGQGGERVVCVSRSSRRRWGKYERGVGKEEP